VFLPIQALFREGDSIKDFPNRVLPVIRVLRQFAVSADFLGIQKVDMCCPYHLVHLRVADAEISSLVIASES
jgi:hypothetical protein